MTKFSQRVIGSEEKSLVKMSDGVVMSIDIGELYNKICGAILGHAYGDALGAPYEFPPYPKFTGRLNEPIVKLSRFYPRRVTPPGQITDDTEMAMALLLTLISGFTKEKAVIEYMNWVNNVYCRPDCPGNAPFTGTNTRNLFVIGAKSKPSWKLYQSRYEKTFDSAEKKESSQSNGCLMRAYPLAFQFDDKITEDDVKLTNPSSVSIEAVKTYVLAIRLALLGVSKEDIKLSVRNLLTLPVLIDLYEKAVANQYVNVANNKRGWVGYGFYCAFWAFFNFDNYKDGVDAVVCLGPTEGRQGFICDSEEKTKSIGDTDTNAAIAGALLGAFYGLQHMCENSELKDDLRVLINVDTRKGDIIRSTRYAPNKDNFKQLSLDSLGLLLKSL